jgi:hypothetical protein
MRWKPSYSLRREDRLRIPRPPFNTGARDWTSNTLARDTIDSSVALIGSGGSTLTATDNIFVGAFGAGNVTAAPEIRDGQLTVPDRPGSGADVNEDVLRAHPWPRP